MFSQTKITGSFHSAAMFIDSWKAPSATAPSPKKATATWVVPRARAEKAPPTAMGMPAPTIALAPRMPSLGSAMCMEPERPPQYPPLRPKSSAIIGSMPPPLAMQCPCPRCVEVMKSSGSKASQMPAATPSWPIDR